MASPDIKPNFTPIKEELAFALFDTPIVAKITSRNYLDLIEPDGRLTPHFETYTRETRPFDFPRKSGEFALKIHQTRPHDPLSEFYLNLRGLPPNLVDLIGKAMAEVKLPKDPDFIAAIPAAANPFVEAMSLHSGIENIDIFDKEETADGRRIVPKEGAPRGHGKLLLLGDDVTSQGVSKDEAIEAAEYLDYQVQEVGVIVVVDRRQGGSDRLTALGYPVTHVYDIPELLDFGLINKRATEAEYNKSRKYLGLTA